MTGVRCQSGRVPTAWVEASSRVWFVAPGAFPGETAGQGESAMVLGVLYRDVLEKTMRMPFRLIPGFVMFGLLVVSAGGQAKAMDPALQVKAEAGDAQAQYRVGLAYAEGAGVEQDYAKAAVWYGRAAEQGNAQAELQMGVLCDHGQGVGQDYGQAAGWYRKAALQGVAEAEFNLGSLYERGLGVPQDATQAADLYRRAAEQGNASAEFNLALLYDNGQGVKQDWAQAAKWYRKAAEQGLARAEDNLGAMYVSGQGVAKDYVEAYFWLDLAAESSSAARQEEAAKARESVGARLAAADVAATKARVAKWVAEHQK